MPLSLIVMLSLIVIVLLGLSTNFGVKYTPSQSGKTNAQDANQNGAKPGGVKNAWIPWVALVLPVSVVFYYSLHTSQALARLGGLIFLGGLVFAIVIAVISNRQNSRRPPK